MIRRSKRLADGISSNVVNSNKPIKKKVKKDPSTKHISNGIFIKSEDVDLSPHNIISNPVKREVQEENEMNFGQLETKDGIKVKSEVGNETKILKEELNRSKEPPEFQQIYQHVVDMRCKIIAPVDTMGCDKLPERLEGKTTARNFRFQVLISLMLSSQTKDEINYKAMVNLHNGLKEKGFKEGLSLEAILEIDEGQIDTWIHSVGFHTRKATYIKKAAVILQQQFNSDIPKTIEEIVSLPGVGPKMGYLLLQRAWDVVDGIGVDSHVLRLANMWSWVPKISKPNAEHTRIELQKWLPKKYWRGINPLLVGFGQTICLPRGKRCDLCTLASTGLCKNVDKKLVSKAQINGFVLGSSRGDLSALVDIEDIVKSEFI